jgi:hypothetical protein
MMPAVGSTERTEPAEPAVRTRGAGERLLQIAVAGTGVFVLIAVAATLVEGLRGAAAVVDAVLFFVGIGSFFVAYARAVARSRTDLLSIGGIYFLAGSAPRRVKVVLLGALAVQVVVALVTASVRPYTALAFGLLVPMFGIGVSGLWGAFHGTYPARPGPSASLPDDE